MGIKIEWDDAEQTRFIYHFDEAWTWDEFFVAKERAKSMLDAVPHKFTVIIDLSATTRLPANSLANSRNALRNGHPNAFLIVLVVPHAVVRTVISTLRDIAPISPRPIELVSTLDEARALAEKRYLTDKTTYVPG